MATIKQGDKDSLQEHSKKKVEYYRKYLEEYLRLLVHAKWVKSIYIYDVFCGVGIYSRDKSKGSPVVAMETIKHIYEKYPSHGKNISLLINDKDSQKVKIASEYINSHCQSQDKYCDFSSFSEPAAEILERIISMISRDRNASAHFLFVDPHGYKDIRKPQIEKIFQSGQCEMLIFLPISQMYRFLRPSSEDKENPSYIPLRRFMEEFAIPMEAPSQLDYIEMIRKAFSFGDKYYTASIPLQADSKNYYALFYITKNLKGLEKVIEVKWAMDTNRGEGHLLRCDYGLFNDIIEKEEVEDIFKKFESDLIVFLSQYRTNWEIYKYGILRGFLTKHINNILKELSQENKIKFDREVRRNAFYVTYEYYKNKTEKYKVRIV